MDLRHDGTLCNTQCKLVKQKHGMNALRRVRVDAEYACEQLVEGLVCFGLLNELTISIPVVLITAPDSNFGHRNILRMSGANNLPVRIGS